MNETANKPPAGLRGIALFEVLKGTLAVVAAVVLFRVRHSDLHTTTDAFLLRHGINPEFHYIRWVIEHLAKLANQHVGQIVAICLAYTIVRFVEAYGLWHCKGWAEWFAALSTAIYLPWELTHFFHHPAIISLGIVVVNVAIVVYLARLLLRQRPQLAPKPVPRASVAQG